jgi:hypothetical protein
MARITIAVVIAVVLFGGVLAADQALQNPDLEPSNNSTDAKQQQFVEATLPLIELAPVAIIALVVGTILGAVRAVGGG